MSGGSRTTPGSLGSLKPNGSFPSDASGMPILGGANPASWTVTGLNGGGGNQANTTYAFAICATGGPAVTVSVVHAQVPGPALATAAGQTTATCPTGTALLGGGGGISDAFGLPGSQGDHLTGSYPSDGTGTPIASGTAASWTAASHTGGVDSGSLTQTDSWAMCASSADAPPPLAGPAFPLDTSPPSISGATTVGRTLTETHGRWTNQPTGYSYRWLRCTYTGSTCAAIDGAHRQSYKLAVADIGSRVRVQETARNTAGASSPATSPTTAAVRATRISTAEIKALLGRQIVPTGQQRKIANMLVRGSTVLAFTGLEAGRALVGWYLPASSAAKPVLAAVGRLSFSSARATTIEMRLTSAGNQALNGASVVRLSAVGVFTPAGGPAISVTKSFVLRR